MVIAALKLGALAIAGVAAIGGATVTNPCCPIETISCQSGQVSWPKATCATGVTQSHNFPFVLLTCPPGENAISGAFRDDLASFTGGPPVMVQATPAVGPTGDRTPTYRFVWAPADNASGAVALAQVRVYITCQA
jgi:hypothetical protein